MNTNYRISVVVPVFNEELVIDACVERLTRVLRGMGCDYELLFVNDGSRDRTLSLLKQSQTQDNYIKIVNLSRNYGHQIAITAGLDHASGDAAIIIDADLQDPPELFPALVSKWQEGFDIVHARRRRRSGESAFKLSTAGIFYRLLRRLTNVDIPVDVGDFRLISQRALISFRRLGERRRYVRGMIAWLGYRQAFVEFDRDRRFAGKSKHSLSVMLRLSLDALSSFSVIPLRFSTLAGIFSVSAGIVYGLLALADHIFCHRGNANIDLLIFLTAFLGGIQLISIGIVGEYIGAIHEEAKRRPLYLTADVIGIENAEELSYRAKVLELERI